MLQLKTQRKEAFDLAASVAAHPVTVLATFRGPWCPGCQAWWRDFADREDDFAGAGVTVLGLSADKPKALRKFTKKLDTSYTFLSDPKLTAHDKLDVPVQRAHPMAPTYKKGAFLQPAIFIWTPDGRLRWHWYNDSRMGTLYGATGRITAKTVLKRARRALRDYEMEQVTTDEAEASVAPRAEAPEPPAEAPTTPPEA